MLSLQSRARPAHTLPSFLLLALSFVCSTHCSLLSDSATAYEILEENGFPAGLLPETVSGYELAQDGDFTLHLHAACSVRIPNLYPINYRAKITGNIASGKLSSLSGIKVKVLLIWWGITSITVSGENLVFKVGPIRRSYAARYFDENPACADHSQGESHFGSALRRGPETRVLNLTS